MTQQMLSNVDRQAASLAADAQRATAGIAASVAEMRKTILQQLDRMMIAAEEIRRIADGRQPTGKRATVTLRDHFAGVGDSGEAAPLAYKFADAMMKARKKTARPAKSAKRVAGGKKSARTRAARKATKTLLRPGTQAATRTNRSTPSYAEQRAIVRAWAPQFFRSDSFVEYNRKQLAAQLHVFPKVMTKELKAMCADGALKHNGEIRKSSYRVLTGGRKGANGHTVRA